VRRRGLGRARRLSSMQKQWAPVVRQNLDWLSQPAAFAKRVMSLKTESANNVNPVGLNLTGLMKADQVA